LVVSVRNVDSGCSDRSCQVSAWLRSMMAGSTICRSSAMRATSSLSGSSSAR